MSKLEMGKTAVFFRTVTIQGQVIHKLNTVEKNPKASESTIHLQNMC